MYCKLCIVTGYWAVMAKAKKPEAAGADGELQVVD